MSEPGASAGVSRKLLELRVPELRAELDRRSLDSRGVKAVLIERLSKAIQREGRDPEDFEINSGSVNEKKTPMKKSIVADGTSDEPEENMEEVNMDNLVVKDEITDEDSNVEMTDSMISVDTTLNDSIQNKSRKREASEGAESLQVKKICKDKDLNGMEGDDSINLDIGEDDFLNDDGETTHNIKKDIKMEQQGVADSSAEKATEQSQHRAVKEDIDADSLKQEQKENSSEVPSTEDFKDNSSATNADDDKQDRDGKKGSLLSLNNSSRNLWVSGLSSSTRANDLKQLCSAHGKVIGAKIVINARTPGSRCYGYITMATSDDAQNCIKHLHRTELHGRMISMEKAKSETITGPNPGAGANNVKNASPHRPIKEKPTPIVMDKKDLTSKNSSGEKEDSKNADKSVSKDRKDSTGKSDSESKQASSKSKKDRARGERSARHPSSRDFLSFSKIKKEREAQRARELVRRARSEERRRHAAERSLRELENRHRDEKYRQRVEKERLAIEREKIRIEREKIEREKHELQRLERERQKLERERLDLERLELKRAKMRLEEERERTAAKRYLYSSQTGNSSTAMIPRAKEPPPPPTYDRPSGVGHGGSSTARKSVERGRSSRERRERERPRDFKRDYPILPPRSSHTSSNISSSAMKYSSNGPSYESSRQPLPPANRSRDQRGYGMESDSIRSSTGASRSGGGSTHDRGGGSSSNYRPGDSSRRSPKPSSRDHRYSDSSVLKGDSWSGGGVGPESSSRYGGTVPSSSQYNDSRYGSYQPTPPGSNSYPDVICYPVQRDYRAKY